MPFVGAGNAIDFIDITYNATTQFLVGDIPPSAPRSVFAFFSREDFDVHRHVFQSEAPIEIEWDVDPNDLSRLTQLTVRTGQEPPGEGPTDTS